MSMLASGGMEMKPKGLGLWYEPDTDYLMPGCNVKQIKDKVNIFFPTVMCRRGGLFFGGGGGVQVQRRSDNAGSISVQDAEMLCSCLLCSSSPWGLRKYYQTMGNWRLGAHLFCFPSFSTVPGTQGTQWVSIFAVTREGDDWCLLFLCSWLSPEYSTCVWKAVFRNATDWAAAFVPLLNSLVTTEGGGLPRNSCSPV